MEQQAAVRDCRKIAKEIHLLEAQVYFYKFVAEVFDMAGLLVATLVKREAEQILRCYKNVCGR